MKLNLKFKYLIVRLFEEKQGERYKVTQEHL